MIARNFFWGWRWVSFLCACRGWKRSIHYLDRANATAVAYLLVRLAFFPSLSLTTSRPSSQPAKGQPKASLPTFAAMGKKGRKELNPADAYRKEQRKREIKKNKKDRKRVRELGSYIKDPNLMKTEVCAGEGAWLGLAPRTRVLACVRAYSFFHGQCPLPESILGRSAADRPPIGRQSWANPGQILLLHSITPFSY
jgi:hypothetical protein